MFKLVALSDNAILPQMQEGSDYMKYILNTFIPRYSYFLWNNYHGTHSQYPNAKSVDADSDSILRFYDELLEMSPLSEYISKKELKILEQKLTLSDSFVMMNYIKNVYQFHYGADLIEDLPSINSFKSLFTHFIQCYASAYITPDGILTICSNTEFDLPPHN